MVSTVGTRICYRMNDKEPKQTDTTLHRSCCWSAATGVQQLVDWLPHCHDDRSERQLLELLAQGESVRHWLAVLPAVKLLVTSAGELLLVISAGQLLLLCAARPACATIQPVRP